MIDEKSAVVDVYHPQKRYGLIYTDPPWEQTKGGYRKSRPNSSGGKLDYPVMPLGEIVQFHKEVLPLLAQEYHNVFMWTIDKFLIPTERFMEEIGYVRHARIVWNKLAGMAPAYTVRFTCEYLIWFYPKGHMLFPDKDTRGKYPTIMQEAVKRHSQKPECAYRMLEDMFRQTEKIDSCICLYVNPPDKLRCYLSPTHSPEWTRALSYAAQISMLSNIATK